jgi:hypothetical protein
MFFGMRLIAAVVGSKLILGVTIVRTPVQDAGVALMVLAMTAYSAVQWRLGAAAARRQRGAGEQGQ